MLHDHWSNNLTIIIAQLRHNDRTTDQAIKWLASPRKMSSGEHFPSHVKIPDFISSKILAKANKLFRV